MTSPSETRRGFPTFHLMAKPIRWICKSRRRLYTVALVLLAMAAVPPLWWATQLLGLPDIGEPFDVSAYQASTIPDDQNAFVLYNGAAAILKPISEFQKGTIQQVELNTRWSKASPGVQRWAEENQAALSLLRRGSEKPDAFDPDIRSSGENWRTFNCLQSFRFLALLEASRLEEQGDMVGSWVWYRAYLRCLHHIGMHSTARRRMVAQFWHKDLLTRLKTWSADARTPSATLRGALKDLVACESLAPSESDTLKLAYIAIERQFHDPKNPALNMPPAWYMSLATRPTTRPFVHLLMGWLDPKQIEKSLLLWRLWRREPERSSRVLRLVLANWLAYYALPREARPKPDPSISLIADFYEFGSKAPANARVLSPASLSRWLDSSHDARLLLSELNLSSTRMDEWANQRDLLILLGTQLYRRDHGSDPPTPEALVGPYLVRLPAETPEDQTDQTLPNTRDTIR